jgi:hypothetical protein
MIDAVVNKFTAILFLFVLWNKVLGHSDDVRPSHETVGSDNVIQQGIFPDLIGVPGNNGTSNSRSLFQDRIVGGTAASAGEFPFFGKLVFFSLLHAYPDLKRDERIHPQLANIM